MMTMHTTDKPFKITKKQVYEAYKAVKSNHGAAGVDKVESVNQDENSATIRMKKALGRMACRREGVARP